VKIPDVDLSKLLVELLVVLLHHIIENVHLVVYFGRHAFYGFHVHIERLVDELAAQADAHVELGWGVHERIDEPHTRHKICKMCQINGRERQKWGQKGGTG
jgi:hypothetical protein